MPAITFQRRFLDALLSGDKQQTTRKQTDRIKVGDVCNIYIEQRVRIADKPTRQMTELGRDMIHKKRTIAHDTRSYPPVHPDTWVRGIYFAHFLGKVEITEVYNIQPNEMLGTERNEWAIADGFHGFHPWSSISSNGIQQDIGANMWFLDKYGDGWMTQTWTVIRWDGWTERYFEPTL